MKHIALMACMFAPIPGMKYQNTMQHDRQLNHRTRYSIVESKKIVLHQGDQTIILDEQDVCILFVAVSTDSEEPYDAKKEGCQA